MLSRQDLLILMTYLLTDIKILSDVQLNTYGKIPCKFQFNTSSRLGRVVWRGYFYFDLASDGH